MTYQLLLHPLVETDLQKSYDWHESQQEELGDKFLYHYEAMQDKILANPYLFPTVLDEVRRCVFTKFEGTKFPYTIFFELYNNTIFILCVHHQRQSPHEWQSRV